MRIYFSYSKDVRDKAIDEKIVSAIEGKGFFLHIGRKETWFNVESAKDVQTIICTAAKCVDPKNVSVYIDSHKNGLELMVN